MHYDSVKLVLESGRIIFSVASDRIHAYEKISGDFIILGIVECYDVRIIVMTKIFPVYIKNICIRTEYYGYLPQTPVFLQSYGLEPLTMSRFCLQDKVNILKYWI